MCIPSEPPGVLLTLITPPEEEKGLSVFGGLIIFQVNRPGQLLFQRISGFIPQGLRKDGKWQWKIAGFP